MLQHNSLVLVADSASPQYNRRLKCHPVVIQHCQFNPQLMSFCLVRFGKILKEYFLQCKKICIWPKQLAKSEQVQIHGLLLGFATIQTQISCSLLQQVNLTALTESLWNHIHFMQSKIFLQSWLTEMSKTWFFHQLLSLLCLGGPVETTSLVMPSRTATTPLQHECASKDKLKTY